MRLRTCLRPDRDDETPWPEDPKAHDFGYRPCCTILPAALPSRDSTRLGFRLLFLHRLDAAAMRAIARSGQVTIRFLAVALLGMLWFGPPPDNRRQPKRSTPPSRKNGPRLRTVSEAESKSILTSSCLRCHGGKSTESGLDLSDRVSCSKAATTGLPFFRATAKTVCFSNWRLTGAAHAP